ERLPSATCIAIGPGLGRSRELQTLLRRLLSLATCPLVIDADGLNNLADLSDWSARVAFRPVVLTPHPGEWQRLCGVPASDRRAQSAAAIDLARQTGIAVVLKGSQTLVTDGDTVVLNDSGTPAMATGGSGDVLTGLITALICQGLAVRDAAHLGVHVHGRAAEIAAQQLQTHVVLPTQLIAHLPQAFRAAQRGTLAGN
ncbi:MAG: NAD(P)H-hydrate dehydratase, partial [Planctomycetales bacterium]|nr:NAD(P)H-hydrate dehydratase [Planctomycetales bacterium]